MIRLWLLGVLLAAAPACAQEHGAGLARFMGAGGDSVRYSASGQPGVAGAPAVFRHRLEGSGSLPDGSSGTWTVDGRAGQLALGRPRVVIPDTGVFVPRRLWDLRAGAGYARRLGERRRWGANVSLGSASDEPFLAWREDQLSASAFYQLPSRRRNSWLLLLNYSNNRPFLNDVPLPGFAYVFDDREDRVSGIVGFPFAFVRWRPDDAWTLSAGLFGGAAWSLEAARRLGPAAFYARVERSPLQWLRHDRASATDRLVFDSKDARLGARLGGRGLSLDVSAGRVFDRRFFEARDASRRHASYASLPADWLLEASAAWRWGERRRP